MSRILFLGTFPPPMHGMSASNQAVFQCLQEKGLGIEKLDTSPVSLKRDIVSRLSRFQRIIEAWFRLLSADARYGALYIAISGGWGQAYDIVSLIIARTRKMRCFVHHHSFAYLLRRSLLTSLLISMAGDEATHIVLCPEMEHFLQFNYGVQKILLLSNLAFLQPDICIRPRRKAKVVGYLSNITIEKGANEVITLAYSIKQNKLPYDFVVAGPCHDSVLTQKLLGAIAEGAIAWKGGVYGAEKAKFWREIDVFIFPTQYQNEAEPLVIWEALAAGVPVITYQRGCISEQLGDAGILVPPDEEFIMKAISVLGMWQKRPIVYQYYVQKSEERYRELLSTAKTQREGLVQTIGAGRL